MDDMKIKVSTDKLKSAFSNVTVKIEQVQEAFNQIDEKVAQSISYWESKGQESMKGNYEIRKDDYDRIFKEFDNHVKKLQQIAGIYELTEKSAEESASLLPNDILV